MVLVRVQLQTRYRSQHCVIWHDTIRCPVIFCSMVPYIMARHDVTLHNTAEHIIASFTNSSLSSHLSMASKAHFPLATLSSAWATSITSMAVILLCLRYNRVITVSHVYSLKILHVIRLRTYRSFSDACTAHSPHFFLSNSSATMSSLSDTSCFEVTHSYTIVMISWQDRNLELSRNRMKIFDVTRLAYLSDDIRGQCKYLL